jgi:hypothetical protein
MVRVRLPKKRPAGYRGQNRCLVSSVDSLEQHTHLGEHRCQCGIEEVILLKFDARAVAALFLQLGEVRERTPFRRGRHWLEASWMIQVLGALHSTVLAIYTSLRSNINDRHRTIGIIRDVCSFRVRCDSYPEWLATNSNRRTHDLIGFSVNHVNGSAPTRKNG